MQCFVRLRRHDIYPGQQPLQLFLAQCNHRIRPTPWPGEALFLQPFVPQGEARMVPVQNLQLVTAAITKHKHRMAWRKSCGTRNPRHAMPIASSTHSPFWMSCVPGWMNRCRRRHRRARPARRSTTCTTVEKRHANRSGGGFEGWGLFDAYGFSRSYRSLR